MIRFNEQKYYIVNVHDTILVIYLYMKLGMLLPTIVEKSNTEIYLLEIVFLTYRIIMCSS